MISKWSELKDKAIELRIQGSSIRFIEDELGIPRSTLSGWFKNITLSTEQEYILHQNWIDGLESARKKASEWHHTQKEKRLEAAKLEALKVTEKIDFSDIPNMELALAMLYLGEGFKKNSDTGIGNSDPMILKFFVALLKRLYALTNEDLSCYLHLRADQDSTEMIAYWSNVLNIPEKNFKKTSIDLRTQNSKTHDSYKGVCVVRCGNVAIQRKLVYLSKIYCEKIIADTRD